jgi:hypothetical protein
MVAVIAEVAAVMVAVMVEAVAIESASDQGQ